VDTIILSGRAALSPTLIEHLEERREEARESGAPVSLELGGVGFGVAPHGMGKYRYCLKHPHGQVGITPSKSIPQVRVQPRSEFLHGVGAATAVDWWRDAIEDLCGLTRFSVSRLDLHADFQGWELHGDDRHRFVCRADLRDTHEAGEVLTGFEFGRRKTKTIAARIYDKVAERGADGLGFWQEVWSDLYVEGPPVLRVEFEFGREGLRQFDIDTPDEALEAAGALWASATDDWLTYRSPTGDDTRSRWPVAPEWEAVQRATIRDQAAGLDRLIDASRESSLRQLLPALCGYLASVGAHLGTGGVADTCAALPSLVRDYEVISQRAFADRIAERVRRQAFG